jgi:hypothetical protein
MHQVTTGPNYSLQALAILIPDPAKRHNYEMNDYKAWIDGFPSIKFRNTNFVGPTTIANNSFANTDFPLFRLGRRLSDVCRMCSSEVQEEVFQQAVGLCECY